MTNKFRISDLSSLDTLDPSKLDRDLIIVEVDNKTYSINLHNLKSVIGGGGGGSAQGLADGCIKFVWWDSYSDPPTTVFIVYFDPRGGIVDYTFKHVEDESIIGDLPTPTKDGYRFHGWWSEISAGLSANPGDIIRSNKNLYAHWDKNIDITYHTNNQAKVSFCAGTTRRRYEIDEIVDETTRKIQYRSAVPPYDVLEPFASDTKLSSYARLTKVEDEEGEIYLIGPYSFAGTKNLSSASFSEATSIGLCAFKQSGLKQIYAPKAQSVDAEAFLSCENLRNAYFPVASGIGVRAFQGCTSLSSVTVQGAEYVGTAAFRDCLRLGSVTMPQVSSVGDYAFSGCATAVSVSIPAAKTVGKGAFAGCSSLKETDCTAAENLAPDSVLGAVQLSTMYVDNSVLWSTGNGYDEDADDQVVVSADGTHVVFAVPAIQHVRNGVISSVGASAFVECPVLSSATLQNAEYIGTDAFAGCASLVSVDVSRAQAIGRSAFERCPSLTGISMGSAQDIGARCFLNDIALLSVGLPSAESVGPYVFEGCSSLGVLDMPNVASIGESALYDCSQLSAVRISPDNVNYASLCGDTLLLDKELTKVIWGSAPAARLFELPNSVLSVGPTSMYKCAQLSLVNVPFVKCIGAGAFARCVGLSDLYFTKSTSVPELQDGAFDDTNDRYVVWVNPDIVDFYASAKNWDALAATGHVSAAAVYMGALAGTAAFKWEKTSRTLQYCDPEHRSKISSPFKDDAKLINKAYLLTVSDRTNEVSAVGSNSFYRCSSLSNVFLPRLKAVLSSGFEGCAALSNIDCTRVSEIGDSAFAECASIGSVTAPLLSSTGDNAFYDCLSLSSVDMQALVKIGAGAFQGCTALRSMKCPRVTDIGADAFFDSAVSSVGCVPSAVGQHAFAYTPLTAFDASRLGSVQDGTFEHCERLSLAACPVAVSVGQLAFKGCVSLSGGFSLPLAEEIGTEAFSGCSALASVDCPRAERIGDSAFYGCTGLSSAGIAQAEDIGQYAFYNCHKLKSLSCPQAYSIANYMATNCSAMVSADFSGVSSIGEYSLKNCVSLTALDVPSLVSLGTQAVNGCSSLLSINCPDVRSLGDHPFEGCDSMMTVSIAGDNPAYRTLNGGMVLLDGEATQTLWGSIPGCGDVDLPTSVKTIGSRSFRGSYGLTNVSCDGVMRIKQNSFAGCVNLSSIRCAGVTKILANAFQDCVSLSSIDCPEADTIGGYAFSGCSSLTYANCRDVEEITYRMFFGCESLKDVYIHGSSEPIGLNDPVQSFYGMPDDYTVWVKDTALTAYQEATNWCTISSHISAYQG